MSISRHCLYSNINAKYLTFKLLAPFLQVFFLKNKILKNIHIDKSLTFKSDHSFKILPNPGFGHRMYVTVSIPPCFPPPPAPQKKVSQTWLEALIMLFFPN